MGNSKLVNAVSAVLIVLSMVGGAWLFNNRQVSEHRVLGETQDNYQLFVSEVYDKVQTNYWEKISDAELSNIFLLAINKVSGKNNLLETKDKTGVLSLVKNYEKKEIVSQMVDVVLANLKPFGRSRLYSQKEEKALSNTVNNVAPENDLLKTLGIGKSATDKEVEMAYNKKLKEAKSKEQVATIQQAYKVLKNQDARLVYVTSGIEPTIDYKLIQPSIYYVHLSKFSPTSLDEFVRVMNKTDKLGPELDTLIFDLRGNIGGAIDGLPYFLGPFIGPDNYAYQFYQQGKKDDFKTTTGWLNSMVRYKKVVILIDGQTQSTAEVMAATLKKYNVGVVLGSTTKGWGTVEKVLPIEHQISNDEKYSLFLVHHVTIRDDGQPIEGRGVEPMIFVKSLTWKKELLQRFNNQEIVNVVASLYKN